ncbi:MAG TPA: hypothetical protein PKN28_01980 [Clostridiales bacterium]|nr:hypothetical protein [Clostridiales bacterium]
MIVRKEWALCRQFGWYRRIIVLSLLGQGFFIERSNPNVHFSRAMAKVSITKPNNQN